MKILLSPRLSPSLRKLFAPVRCLLLDVDGVLTDGTIFLGEGIEMKGFNIHDGHSIVLAQRVGIVVGFISGRESPATTRRAKELGVEFVVQSGCSKAESVREAQRQLSVTPQNICYVGDDVIDLPAMRSVALPVAVSNATEEVKKAARYVTQRAGGDGAVREVVELILKSQGLWEKAIEKYLKD